MTDDWFQTASGKRCWITDPDRSEVCIADIASSLSRQVRFAGHIAHDVPHYSVAQHSLIVSRVCSADHALVGLLHDATEAYLQDIIRPLKQVLQPIYKPLELAWARRIGDELGLGDALAHLPADVKLADHRVLVTEKRDLRVESPGHPYGHDVEPLAFRITALSPMQARASFLERFTLLRAEGL